MSSLGLCGARTVGHCPLHRGWISSFVPSLQTTKVLCTCALQPQHYQTQRFALKNGIRRHRWDLHVLWRHLSAKTSGLRLPQVLSTHIPPIYPDLHVPRNGTAMVQIHLKSALQDEQTWWHWKAAWRRICYCWMTPLAEPSLRSATRRVKYLICLKVLLFSQSFFQWFVVWEQTRHFSELPFVWKTERRKTGKHNTGWRDLETRQQHFYSPHHHNPGIDVVTW